MHLACSVTLVSSEVSRLQLTDETRALGLKLIYFYFYQPDVFEYDI